MAQQAIINKGIKEIVLRFGQAIKKQGIPVKKLVIFGSYAKHKAREDSDIDICVVSPKFGKDSIKELQFLFKLRRQIDSRIEPFPVAYKDYQRIVSPIIFEIKKFGREIKI